MDKKTIAGVAVGLALGAGGMAVTPNTPDILTRDDVRVIVDVVNTDFKDAIYYTAEEAIGKSNEDIDTEKTRRYTNYLQTIEDMRIFNETNKLNEEPI